MLCRHLLHRKHNQISLQLFENLSLRCLPDASQCHHMIHQSMTLRATGLSDNTLSAKRVSASLFASIAATTVKNPESAGSRLTPSRILHKVARVARAYTGPGSCGSTQGRETKTEMIWMRRKTSLTTPGGVKPAGPAYAFKDLEQDKCASRQGYPQQMPYWLYMLPRRFRAWS
jgi:hypothetical protein